MTKGSGEFMNAKENRASGAALAFGALCMEDDRLTSARAAKSGRFRFQVSSSRFQVPGFRFQVPSFSF